ncbi:hypothetical protein [Nocardia sp. NPDC005366]|uniref:hypothetical protein n=1 Tax=Nocardia sp. NPDC005366 TaxID=3156878 RepID=UPI0033BD2773
MNSPEAGAPLDAEERAELERLRREVAKIRAAEAGDVSSEIGPSRASGHRVWRWTGAGALLVLVAILAFAAVPARYVRAEILDTDRYVQTMTPLAADPVLQAELSDRITDQIMTRVDIKRVTTEALTALTENAPRVPTAVIGLAPALADQARSFVHDTVDAFVASDRFEALWIRANRGAHRTMVAVVTGETRPGVRVGDDGTVAIELKPIIDGVRAELDERGFTFVDSLPDIDTSFVLFESPGLVKAQRAVSAVDKASTVLPLAVLLAAVAAVLLAPRGARLRAFSLVGISVAIAMMLLVVALSVGRAVYLADVPSEDLSREAAAILFDTLALPLRTAMRAVFVLAVVVAAIGYLAGPSKSAVAVRRGYSSVVNQVRGSAHGRAPRPVEIAVATHRTALRVIIIAIAAMTVVFWKYPSGLVVIVTVLIAVAALLLVELIARPAVAAHHGTT